jgi:hypothetical protein
MAKSLRELRDWGIEVWGAADHGGTSKIRSGEFWDVYQPWEFGLEYEAYQLQREQNVDYRSDNRGQAMDWREEPTGLKPTVLLLHPEHWELRWRTHNV